MTGNIVSSCMAYAMMACFINFTLAQTTQDTAHPFQNFTKAENYDFPLGEVVISRGNVIQASLRYDPINLGGLIGGGWTFPLIESYAIQQSEKRLLCRIPSGETIVIPIVNSLPESGCAFGLRALVNEGVVLVTSSDGPSYTFNKGYLSSIKYSDGQIVKILRNGTSASVEVNGDRIIELSRKSHESVTMRFQRDFYNIEMRELHPILTTIEGLTAVQELKHTISRIICNDAILLEARIEKSETNADSFSYNIEAFDWKHEIDILPARNVVEQKMHDTKIKYETFGRGPLTGRVRSVELPGRPENSLKFSYDATGKLIRAVGSNPKIRLLKTERGYRFENNQDNQALQILYSFDGEYISVENQKN